MLPRSTRFLVAIGGFLLGSAVPAVAADPSAIDYNRDIRPILSDHCFACHGPDKHQRKADLRLDIRENAIELEAIVPGKPEESEVVSRLFETDPDEIMPPSKMNKPLTAAQKDLLKRWVAAGAPYAPHWAYTPLNRPAIPALRDASHVRNPIDAFIQANLESHKIAPSPEADRRRLLRRLSLDLTGLPPTPEEVQAFLQDRSPRAYETQVERLLDSPRFGERMAVPWLDVVRYSDTVGYHGDQNQNAWAYRDYVIDAFNTNLPFDRFTIEQIAGDLLPGAGDRQRLATCFNRLNMMTREGGAQPKEYLAKYAADRVRTVAMAWLGSTFGCAECHDHKFDPIKTRDFYALSAFFADVKQWGVYMDYGYTPNPDLRGYSNDHPFPPEIIVESPALLRRIEGLNQRIAEVVARADVRLDRSPENLAVYEIWLRSIRDLVKSEPGGWQIAPRSVTRAAATPKGKAKAAQGPPTKPDVAEDGIVTLTGQGASNDEVVLEPPPGTLAAVRVELLPDDRGKLFRAGAPEAMLRLKATITRKGARAGKPVAFRDADADRVSPRYRSGFEVIGILDAWKLVEGPAATGVWLLDRPLTIAEGDTLSVTLLDNRAARVRVSVSPLAPDDLKRPGDPPVNPLSRLAYLRSTGWDAAAFEEVKALEREIRSYRGGKTPVMVTESVKPLTTRVLPRGNWQDESGEIVAPAVPQFLPQPRPKEERLTRLDLAEWLVAKENPLPARVFVNRLWKQFFGTGLSAQVDDLGAQGEWPVHPDLLDWLAAEFRDGGWDVKRLVKTLVMSHTYRQSSDLRREVEPLDPGNRWLASQSPRRLDAEFIRDNVLAAVGLIDLEAGGPPSFPYQPAGYYANLQFPDRVYVPDRDERQYRRGVYTHWQRTFLHPMLAAFDAPSREDCIAARTAANSPQQALTLLNDPTFVEAARVLAASVLGKASGDAGRIDLAFERVLSRPASTKERESLLVLLGKVREAYKADPDDARKLLGVGLASAPENADPVELAAWTQVCRVVLNLHETITRY